MSHHLELLVERTFCRMEDWICARISAVMSVVRPGYGHFSVPIKELILQLNTGLNTAHML